MNRALNSFINEIQGKVNIIVCGHIDSATQRKKLLGTSYTEDISFYTANISEGIPGNLYVIANSTEEALERIHLRLMSKYKNLTQNSKATQLIYMHSIFICNKSISGKDTIISIHTIDNTGQLREIYSYKNISLSSLTDIWENTPNSFIKYAIYHGVL